MHIQQRAAALRRRRTAGFTLVEAMVVVGIVAVLAVLSLSALATMKRRSAYAAATGDVQARLQQLRTEAFARGAPTVFVLQKSSGRYWALLDPDANFRLDAFDPATPAAAPDQLLAQGQLDDPVQVGPADGYGQRLPFPYAWVPADSACTLCGAGDLGALVFRGDGTLSLSGPVREGGSFTVFQPGLRRRTFVVLAATGAVESFER